MNLIQAAGGNQAKIIVSQEAFIPAYPRGRSFEAVAGSRSKQGRKDFYEYWNNAITVPGPEVREVGAYVVIGVIEKR